MWLLFTLVNFSHSSFAQANLKPGLWEIKTQMKTENGDVDPMAQMQKSLSQMPAAQRKEAESMMSKRGVAMSGQGMKVCYTPEMIKNQKALLANRNQESGCKTEMTKQTSKHLSMVYHCPDGAKGTGEWNFHGNEKYDGVMKMTTAKGKESEIKNEGRFVSNDCGNVKPLNIQ